MKCFDAETMTRLWESFSAKSTPTKTTRPTPSSEISKALNQERLVLLVEMYRRNQGYVEYDITRVWPSKKY